MPGRKLTVDESDVARCRRYGLDLLAARMTLTGVSTSEGPTGLSARRSANDRATATHPGGVDNNVARRSDPPVLLRPPGRPSARYPAGRGPAGAGHRGHRRRPAATRAAG